MTLLDAVVIYGIILALLGGPIALMISLWRDR